MTTVLMVGNEASQWKGAADVARVAREARAWGFDAICPKRMNGIQKPWYNTLAQLAQEKQAAEDAGCAYKVFGYCYGPVFGNAQIDGEAAGLAEMYNVTGAVVANMEHEWNSQVKAASRFRGALDKLGCKIIVSTWADPVQQNWQGVIKALDAVVLAWSPEQYTNWLADQEPLQLNSIAHKLQPCIELSTNNRTNDAVRNTQLAIARGHSTLWIWEYGQAKNNVALVKSVVGMMSAAFPAPAPTTPTVKTYIVQADDTIVSIAEHLGLDNWYDELWIPNLVALTKAAQEFGHEPHPFVLYPGTVLNY